jgi:hypothetical protein
MFTSQVCKQLVLNPSSLFLSLSLSLSLSLRWSALWFSYSHTASIVFDFILFFGTLQFYISNDAAHDTVLELGKAGVVEFVDLNSDVNPFQRAYAPEIRRCDELQRILRSFHSQAAAIEVNNIIFRFCTIFIETDAKRFV